MKRIGKLFEHIAERGNLGSAAHAAALGKRTRPEVITFFAYLNENLNQISREIRSGTYQFSSYRSFEVCDPKKRTIHAPVFRDRVVHHAIIAVVGPVLESGASPHSYACRRGYGQHRALCQAAEWTRRGRWYGKMDVRKYYDSVNHEILLERLTRRFRESHLLALFRALLASYETTPGHGIPIGALTSQSFGNFYLDRLDSDLAVAGFGRHYVRYMDDSVVWAQSAAGLDPIRKEVIASLARLDLTLKNGGEWNRCNHGVPFLGFVIYPDRIRLGHTGRKRLRRKFKGIKNAYHKGVISEYEAQDRAQSLFAHAGFADDKKWRQMVLELHDFGDEPGPGVCLAGRGVEQHARQLPLSQPQQERAWQPQQEQRLSAGCGPRIGDSNWSPDVAHSRAPVPTENRAESMDKSPARTDTPGGASRKVRPGAPDGLGDNEGGATP